MTIHLRFWVIRVGVACRSVGFRPILRLFARGYVININRFKAECFQIAIDRLPVQRSSAPSYPSLTKPAEEHQKTLSLPRCRSRATFHDLLPATRLSGQSAGDHCLAPRP